MVRVVVWYDGRRAGAQSNPDMVDLDATWGSVEARWTPRGDRGAGEGVWFCRRNGNRQSRTETAVWIIITRLVVTFSVTDKIIIILCVYRKGGKGCGNALPGNVAGQQNRSCIAQIPEQRLNLSRS